MVLPRKPGPQPPMRRRQPPRAPGKAWLDRLRRALTGLFGRRFRPDPARYRAYLSRQAVLRFEADLGAFDSVPALRQRLVELGLQPRESEWTFYLPPGKALDRAFRFLPEIYPPHAGLKLLKDFQPPGDAIYATHALAPDGRGRRPRPGRLTPSPAGLLRVANLLHVGGIGPRVHDLVHLQAGGVDLSAYVVDHVDWSVSEPAAYRTFMARLRPMLRSGLLATLAPKPDLAGDFKPPDCDDNLRIDPASGEPLFVDFQAFVVPDEARLMTTFARSALPHAGGGRRRLYQAVPGLMPGLRDPEKRFAAIAQLLRKPNLDLNGWAVFDIGCNTGLMMAEALAAGALWCFGWDRPAVAQAAERMLAALGASRCTVYGATIDNETDVAGMLPSTYRLHARSLLLYLDVDEAIGFPPGVGYLPWRYMVYEGPPDRGVGQAWRRLQQSGWLRDGQLLGHTLLSDGGGRPRPLMLVRRDLR